MFPNALESRGPVRKAAWVWLPMSYGSRQRAARTSGGTSRSSFVASAEVAFQAVDLLPIDWADQLRCLDSYDSISVCLG